MYIVTVGLLGDQMLPLLWVPLHHFDAEDVGDHMLLFFFFFKTNLLISASLCKLVFSGRSVIEVHEKRKISWV